MVTFRPAPDGVAGGCSSEAITAFASGVGVGEHPTAKNRLVTRREVAAKARMDAMDLTIRFSPKEFWAEAVVGEVGVSAD
jgi:hypothetical protein